MDKNSRDQYLFQKKSLILLLYLYYRTGVHYESITLRSFGFHFDPTCNFKAIVKSKKEHIHKYTIHIYTSLFRVNLEEMDVMGNVNIIKVKNAKDDAYAPNASVNIYFDGDRFKVVGFVEGQRVLIESPKHEKGQDLLSVLESGEHHNESADSFLLWLMRFYSTKLPTDLVMGAGINKDYGAKDWMELLNSLNLKFYAGETTSKEEVKHYIGEEVLTSPSLMQQKGFNIYKELAHELYEFEEAKSFNDPDSTLYRCVDFLQAHPGTSVITYNYDTNLEYVLRKRDLLYSTIYDDNSFTVKNAIATIYHVHGLLPYGKYDQEKFTDSLIFNESDYYYLYNNPYSWNIAKQLHDFKFNVCFFIGISLTDPDMKRLLELGQNYLKYNFIFMKRQKGYSPSVFNIISSYFFTFDLIVIWVNEYEEIGDWLKRL